jgi:hypothetical protein
MSALLTNKEVYFPNSLSIPILSRTMRCYGMKGIYFINERESINGLSKESSAVLQNQAILHFIERNQIQLIRLNPYQIHDYYTIPHALLYDLKREKNYFDCFIYYSEQMVEDFKITYPARWLILKSYFKEVINLEKHKEFTGQEII